MAEQREFHIGDVLSVTTGVMLSPRGMDGLYDILNFMTGDNLFTHQLPRASEEVKPLLLAQHPQLADVDASGVTRENWHGWLEDQVARFGEMVPVTAVPDAHLVRDPIVDAAERLGPDRVITAPRQELLK